MKCTICGAEYPDARHKGPYCSLRCAYEKNKVKEAQEPKKIRLRIDPRKLPKPPRPRTVEYRTKERPARALHLDGDWLLYDDVDGAERLREHAERGRRNSIKARTFTPEEDAIILQLAEEGETPNSSRKSWEGQPGQWPTI